MIIKERMNKDKHKLIMPPSGIIDLTPLSAKQGKFLMTVSPNQRKIRNRLISIINKFLKR